MDSWNGALRRQHGKCRWESITAITATRNSKTLQLLGNVISRAPLTSAPNPSGTTPSNPKAYIDGGGGAFTKGVCNRFVKTGFCPYGDSCKYLHPTNSNNLQNNVNLFQATRLMNNVHSPIILGNQLVGGSSLPADVVRDSMGMPWGNLPPSLKPPPEGGYLPFPFVDWG